MSDFLISYADCDVQKRISYLSPVSKQVPKSNPPQPYQEVPLQFNYGDADTPRVDQFYMELPELYSSLGISEKPGQGGKADISIMISLPQDNPEIKLATEKLGDIWTACCAILNIFKGQLGLQRIKWDQPEIAAAAFKTPVYWPTNKITGEPEIGKNPSMFLKLFRRGSGVLEEKTLFVKHRVDEQGSPVFDTKGNAEYDSLDWNLLKGVEMRFIPVMHIKKIYIGGGKPSIQMEMVSAVVTYLKPRGTTSRQIGTLNRLAHEDPNVATTMAESVAKLTLQRQGPIEAQMTPTMAAAGQQDPLGPGMAHQLNPAQGFQDFIAGNAAPTPTIGLPGKMPAFN